MGAQNMACVLRFARWPFFALFRLSRPANYYLKLSRGIGQLTLTKNTVLCCRYSRALYNNTLAPRAAETKHYGKRRGDGGVAIKGGRLGPGQTKEEGKPSRMEIRLHEWPKILTRWVEHNFIFINKF